MADEPIRKARWRLILGKGAEDALGDDVLTPQQQEQEQAVGFLYDREYGEDERDVRTITEPSGGLQESQLNVPDWINKIHELFPKQTIERLERDALERYQLEEMVMNPQMLERVQPSETLLKAILRTKHLMNEEVLLLARRLVQQVIEQMMEKLAREVQTAFGGSRNRLHRSPLRVAQNFDAWTTVKRNLHHYDPQTQKLYIQTPYFYSRVRRHADKWQIIILVDQSGSMLNSAIHASLSASIFWGIPALRTHLVVFDTAVVDLTAVCSDPVETLLKIQLGGGTDIGQALTYAETLIDNPRQTILILITDFFEGAPLATLFGMTRQLVESGVTLLGLAALDNNANPHYSKSIAQSMVDLGAEVGAMTPGELAAWVSEKVSQ